MENLVDIAVALIGGGLAVFLFRVLNPKASKENQAVIVKVNELGSTNEILMKQAEENMRIAKEKADALEKEKNKEVSKEELEEFFNKRKDIQ